MIVKKGAQYCVVSEKKDKQGHHKNLGCYPTREEAVKRLQTVEMFKHQKGK